MSVLGPVRDISQVQMGGDEAPVWWADYPNHLFCGTQGYMKYAESEGFGCHISPHPQKM
jgi:hypothetical protein